MFSSSKVVLLSSRRDMGLGSDEPWYHGLYKIAYPVISRSFDEIIANGENVKKYVAEREKISLNKIMVIHNGKSIPEYIHTKPPVFNEIQAKIWIGIVANLKPVKRIDVFLNALSHLRSTCKSLNFQALVFGEGPKRGSLQNLVEELNLLSYVRFLGSVKNITAYLQHLDIGVLVSDREGFSNAILEYMACGLPVVATAVGGNPELVDETNGFCVPPGDPEAIAVALASLALSPNLRKKMGNRSIEKVSQHYTWDKIIYEWENYYRLLISGKHDMHLYTR